MTIFLLVFLLFIGWLFIDFRLGRKKHLQTASKRLYPNRNGKWMLFGDGQELYRSYFQDISDAKHHIHILFYIVKNDNVGHEFFSLLKRKARHGVKVRLLLDRIGSRNISKKEITELQNCGIEFAFSNRPVFPFFFYSLNYRNHRKVTVIDGKIGYFGGFNIGKEYLGQDPQLGYWRDYHLKLYGDGVQDLQTEFHLDWKRATGKYVPNDYRYFPSLIKGSLPLRFIPTDGAFIKEFLLELIQNAKSEIIIGTPYFIPGSEILTEILNASYRGVSVTVLVPLKADHAFVREASFPYFKKLLAAGCNIYRYTHGFYHGKIVLIDNELCDFGTANFDKRSFFINDELNCLITDPQFISKIQEEFKKDLYMHSEKLTISAYNKRPWLQRSKEAFSSFISDLL
ncbi:cardiolipin synthase [Calidifontibacillus oryziterrae]|uniref:cardiolipin synthase n=1 Tax=Calidifontibacillus oryziterrae TaxID=1191699 RepID=UPI00030296ED|nr:cardiolipin synthase [Calidifontibacillus oryziterrae]